MPKLPLVKFDWSKDKPGWKLAAWVFRPTTILSIGAVLGVILGR